MKAETTSRVGIRNPSSSPVLVIFEPWAHEYTLPPGATFVFEATSPLPGWLSVEHDGPDVIVSAWDSCVGKVFNKAGELLHELNTRVPDFSTPAAQHKNPGPAV